MQVTQQIFETLKNAFDREAKAGNFNVENFRMLQQMEKQLKGE